MGGDGWGGKQAMGLESSRHLFYSSFFFFSFLFFFGPYLLRRPATVRGYEGGGKRGGGRRGGRRGKGKTGGGGEEEERGWTGSDRSGWKLVPLD